jgi:hypothetical protein
MILTQTYGGINRSFLGHLRLSIIFYYPANGNWYNRDSTVYQIFKKAALAIVMIMHPDVLMHFLTQKMVNRNTLICFQQFGQNCISRGMELAKFPVLLRCVIKHYRCISHLSYSENVHFYCVTQWNRLFHHLELCRMSNVTYSHWIIKV